MKATIILGAGFSKNSGIPVQAEIPALLISGDFGNGFEQAVTLFLKEFMKDVFGYNGDLNFPDIEDMLTCIDLSTNSGHHLGIAYSPVKLRAVRRFLVYRIFSILEERFQFSEEIRSFIKEIGRDYDQISFIVLNWDTVLEKYLADLWPGIAIDYCNGGICFDTGETRKDGKAIKVVKPHGSSNWLYCDNCREVFNDTGNKVSLKTKAGFIEADLELLRKYVNDLSGFDDALVEHCTICGNRASSHIATFSYRKTFRANSFPDIWRQAEQILTDSDRWIFIGYSLPDADYEFKHLLKLAELKLKHKKAKKLEIDVILAGSDATMGKYKCLFGSAINTICNDGIGGYLKSL